MNDIALLKSQLLDLSEYLGGPILGIDSSGPITSLCVVGFESGIVDELEMDAKALPSDTLAETIAERIHQSKRASGDIRAIVVGIGPGSFTGIRVGLATAKGMALAAEIPVYGISSLAVLALSAGSPWVAVCVDARHGEVYSALYYVCSRGTLEPVIEDATRSPTEFHSLVSNAVQQRNINSLSVVGDFAQAFVADGDFAVEVSVKHPTTPKMSTAIRAMAVRLKAKDADCVKTLSPQYMRLTAAERNHLR